MGNTNLSLNHLDELIDRSIEENSRSFECADKTITFEVDNPEDSESETSPYIHIADPEDDIKSLRNADEIVTNEKIQICFNYPLSRCVTFKYDEGPYTRGELARLICDQYAKIYQEEEDTSGIAPAQVSPLLLNRNLTSGKYGIWGYDICDLELHTVYMRNRNNETICTLGIDS